MKHPTIKNLKKTPPNGPVRLALTLNREESTERLLVGEEAQLKAYLDGNDQAQVYYDAKLPLGGFLYFHEIQSNEKWNDPSISLLKEALSSLIRRKEREQRAWELLADRMDGKDPLSIYIACQRWQLYTRLRTGLASAKNAEAFPTLANQLTESFVYSIKTSERYISPAEHLQKATEAVISDCNLGRAEIYYPAGMRTEEYIFLDGSCWMGLFYCLNRFRLWDFSFCRCVNCGKWFAAPSRHHTLCSDSCKRQKNRQNKQKFDQRAKENGFEIQYKNVSQRMRNRLNTIRSRRDLPEEELDLAEETFSEFRKEAIQRKKKIQSPEDSETFTQWLLEQEQRFRFLTEL